MPADRDSSFSRALTIQLRVIGALLMREILTRYGRHNVGFLWLFLEPALFTLGITALWTATQATHGSSLPIVAFAVTGYSSVLLWRNGANRCAKAIEPNLSLLYHRNVRVFDLFLSRLGLEIAGSTMSLVLLMSIFWSLELMTPPADALLMIMAWLLLSFFAIGLGLIIGALSERSDSFERIWHTVTYLTFPLSGALFMVDWLPKMAQDAVLLLPMVHGVEMLRHGYFGDAVTPHYEAAYLGAADLLLLLLGLAMVRETGRRVEPE